MSTNKIQLEEINIIRPILICVSLVMYHAFAPYGDVNAWHIDGVYKVGGYYWLDKFVYSFMLETFVFISGYVFAFQLSGENKYTFKRVLLGKLQRLIIPSIIFSCIYVFIFYDTHKPLQFIYDIFNGVGHMWFLPMLFWCFLAAYFIEKLKITEYIKLLFLFLLSLFSFLPLPFQMGQTCYYLFFFYAAFVVYRNRSEVVKRIKKPWILLIVISIYIISFVFFTILREYIISFQAGSMGSKIVKMLLYKSTMLFYSSFGVLSFYLIALRISDRGFQTPKWIKELNKLCMGIYIAHQFILMALYYHTEISVWAGLYWLPWVGYVTALILSIVFAYLVRLTSIGRQLI